MSDDEVVDYMVLTEHCITGTHSFCLGKKKTQAGEMKCTCRCHYPEGIINE